MRAGNAFLYKVSGIYAIFNTLTKEIYIGQSVDIGARWARHLSNFQDKKEPGFPLPLYEAIRFLGVENFTFKILERCPKGRLADAEKFWINHYSEKYKVYNKLLVKK